MSKFTNVQRQQGYPALEVYEGNNFLSLGITGFGGTLDIHMKPDDALKLAKVLEAAAMRVKEQEQAA